jgi:ABC-type transport system involved in multi-copper enzyme maturation permease subunit
MLNLLLAETKKILWNYKLTSFLVWVYPIGIAVFHLVACLAALMPDQFFAKAMLAAGSGNWTVDALGVWGIISAFPLNIFGRMLPLAFIAAVFAGEYEWGTWKNIVPRNRRSALILAKYTVLTGLFIVSFLMTSIAAVLGQAIARHMIGLPYGPEPTGAALSSFAGDFLQTAGLGIVSLLILEAAAALVALLTRSVLAGMLVGFGISMVDTTSFLILVLFGVLFRKPELVELFRYTSSYNLQNVLSWLETGVGYMPGVPGFSDASPLAFSLVMLAIWACGLVGLSIWVFRRQDLGS